MSTQITTAFVQQYSSNVQLLMQQKGSVLEQFVSKVDVKGEYRYVDQVGKAIAQLRTTRHGDTPLSNTPHSRRRLELNDWEYADLIDDEDRIRTLIDPTSAYVMAAAMAMGRAKDKEIIDAIMGTAKAGKQGGTDVSFDSNNIIADDSKGFTFDKLREAKRILDKNCVPNDGRRVIALSANQLSDLLSETKVTSSDYAAAQALVRGEITEFMGFRFVQVNGQRDASNDLLVVSSSVRKCLAWHPDCVVLGVGRDVSCEINKRPDKSNATQIDFKMSIGATRLEEGGCVEIDCAEA